MGKSGWLPNISENFSFFKNLAINDLQRKDYEGATSGLCNLNECLGEDYLVSISTALYHKTIDQEIVYLCNHCTMTIDKIVNQGEEDEKTTQIEVPTEIPLSQVKIVKLPLSTLNQILEKSKTEDVWYCPKCKKRNSLKTTDDIIPVKENPFCVQVVPDPPRVGYGISTRLGFHEGYVKWFNNFLQEITWQEVLYRKEYQNQHGFDMGDDQDVFKDKGDKS